MAPYSVGTVINVNGPWSGLSRLGFIHQAAADGPEIKPSVRPSWPTAIKFTFAGMSEGGAELLWFCQELDGKKAPNKKHQTLT